MRDKIKELESEVAKIEDGKADISTLNHAIYLTGLVLEQLHIVRFKAYTEPQEGSNPEPMAFDFSEREAPETLELPIEEAPAQVLVEDLYRLFIVWCMAKNIKKNIKEEEFKTELDDKKYKLKSTAKHPNLYLEKIEYKIKT